MKTRKRKRAKPYSLRVFNGGEDNYYLYPAREYGDWDLLARYVEEGNVITPAMRGFLAEVLRGAKRKKGAPRSRETSERASQILQYVLDSMHNGQTESAAKKAAAIEFGVDKRTIQRNMKEFNDYQMDERRADELSEMGAEWNEEQEAMGWDDN